VGKVFLGISDIPGRAPHTILPASASAVRSSANQHLSAAERYIDNVQVAVLSHPESGPSTDNAGPKLARTRTMAVCEAVGLAVRRDRPAAQPPLVVRPAEAKLELSANRAVQRAAGAAARRPTAGMSPQETADSPIAL